MGRPRFLVLWYAILLAFVVSTYTIFNGDDPPAAQPPNVINYEFMADCVAEQGYVTQYHSTMAELERMLRACGTFATNRPAGWP